MGYVYNTCKMKARKIFGFYYWYLQLRLIYDKLELCCAIDYVTSLSDSLHLIILFYSLKS